MKFVFTAHKLNYTSLLHSTGIACALYLSYQACANENLLYLDESSGAYTYTCTKMGVSLDYLAGNSKVLLEKNIVKRITDIQQLPTDDKAHLFALMDAFLRDYKAKKAYA